MDSDSFNLRNTISSSGDLKRFNCLYCKKQFSTRFSKDRHQQNMHEMENDTSSDENGASDESDISSEHESSTSDTEEVSSSSASDEMEESNVEDSSDTNADDKMEESNVEESTTEDCYDETTSSDSDNEAQAFDDLLEDTLKCYEEEYAKLMPNDQNEESIDALRKRVSKTFRSKLITYILRLEDKIGDPLFRNIIEKIKMLRKEGFDEDDAVHTAVSYWKHSINNLIPFK